MMTREEAIKQFREELRRVRERYERLVDALASGRIASQEARELAYERLIALEEEMFSLEDKIDTLEEGGEIL